MLDRIPLKGLVVGIFFSLALLSCAEGASNPNRQKKPLPKFEDAKTMLVRHFQSLPSYQPGGILAKSEVEPIFKHLRQMGWRVADQKAILDQVPADNSFLVRELRTPAGRKFTTHIAKYPDGYDRLDRLSRLPQGKKLVRDFIRGPEGYKMLQYMTETRGGKNMGKLLSKAPKGKNFNKPTGRIYTLDMLLDALKKQYDQIKAARRRRSIARPHNQRADLATSTV